MQDLLKQLAIFIERGKADLNSPYPPDLKGQEGALELTRNALESGVSPSVILKKGLMPGMNRIGEKFAKGEAFIPDLLMSAKAMNGVMALLKPHFETGEVQHRGTIILGTVAGDLHEIGKNVVRMVLEGGGWEVIDLGVDAGVDKFMASLQQYPNAKVGMSALLTTTMATMEQAVKQIKEKHPATEIYVGGAPLTLEFCNKIGADGYFPEPHSFARHLDSIG